MKKSIHVELTMPQALRVLMLLYDERKNLEIVLTQIRPIGGHDWTRAWEKLNQVAQVYTRILDASNSKVEN